MFARDLDLLRGGIHVELHSFCLAVGVVYNLILSYRHFFPSLKFSISHVELSIYLSLRFDTFDNVVDVEH